MKKNIALATIVAGGVFMTSLTASAQPAAPAGPAAPAAPAAGGAAAEAPKAEGGGDEKKIGVGADLQFLLPLGDAADVTGPLVGPMLRVGYRVIPALELTGRIGYLFGLSKDQSVGPVTASTSLSNIPVWVGGRYFIMNPQEGLYGALEIGMNALSSSVEVGGSSTSTGMTRFGANIGLGYVISKELPIDIRAQFSMLNLIGKEEVAGVSESSINAIGLSAGYTFQF